VNWSLSVGVTCGPVGVYGGLSVDTMLGVVNAGNVTTDVGVLSVGMVVVGAYKTREDPWIGKDALAQLIQGHL